jgi:branched-chain amino acid transport system ATP-binding protein
VAVTVPALATRGLGLRIGGAVIVDDVSLEVAEGEFLTVIGPNGAGKTSLFNLLSGLYRPTAGRVTLAGQDVTGRSSAARARAGLGRTFQTSNVFPELSVVENVRVAVQARRGGSLAAWRRAAGDLETIRRARKALELVGLGAREEQPSRSLSHGDKRKLELAMLLGGEFSVLLLDEPTAGMSAEDVPEIMSVIRAIHREEGRTVLMVEHRMDVIGVLTDRIAVMHHGRLLTVGTPQRVMADPSVQEAYLGEPL